MPESRNRDRRRMGVNFFSVLRAARKVTSDPEFEPGSIRELSEAILTQIIGQDLSQARTEMAEINWEALLAFIEKILPLILMIFGL